VAGVMLEEGQEGEEGEKGQEGQEGQEGRKVDLVSPLRIALPEGDTRRQFISAARRFVGFAGEKESYGREDVLAYFRHLEERGYKFEEAGLEWQLRPRRDLPPLVEEELQRPLFTRTEVVRLITRARENCDERQCAMLALSTTYGLRRAELAQLALEDVDVEAGTITIRTKKHGHLRTHLIPQEVKPWIESYSFKPLAPRSLSLIFTEICRRTGVERPPRSGWHSLRRTLDSELLFGVVPPEEYRAMWPIYCYDFMRWRYRKEVEFGMHSIYGRLTPERVDRAIFSVHPFTPYWKT